VAEEEVAEEVAEEEEAEEVLIPALEGKRIFWEA